MEQSTNNPISQELKTRTTDEEPFNICLTNNYAFLKIFKKEEPYWKLPPCIHVGILNFNMMKSPGYYHKVTLRDEKQISLKSKRNHVTNIESIYAITWFLLLYHEQ